MRVRPIHVYLVHEGEAHFELLSMHLFYLLVCLCLLVQKLAAGEADDLKALSLVASIQLHQLPVVLLGEGSLGGDVDDEGALLALHVVAEH